MAGEGAGGTRLTTPLMRATLVVAVLLTFTAFVQLYLFSGDTDRWFAWTIAEPLTAAVLGSLYFASSIAAFLSLRAREWARARVILPSVMVFIWGTLLVTLLHADKFHFGDEHLVSAQVFAWSWLAVYALDPILVTVAWIHQARRPGTDPPGGRALSAPYRGLLAAWTGVCAFLGVSLLVAPTWAEDWWPWALTPLTARALGVWLLAFAVLFATMFDEDDLDRIRPGAAPLIALAGLLFVALVRYWDHVSSGWGRVLYLVAVLGLSLVAAPSLAQVTGSGTRTSLSRSGSSSLGPLRR